MKSTMTALLLLLLLLSLPTLASDFRSCSLSDSQRSVLHFSYHYGKEWGLGYTLAAIAMRESRLGDVNINLNDPSASPWHVTVDKYVRSRGWVNTPYNRNRAAHRLMHDFHAGAHLAIEELLYWNGRHSNLTGNNRWRATVASYNAGNRWRGERGQDYAEIISQNISHIKACRWIDESV